MSIEEQERLDSKEKTKQYKKAKVIYEHQSLHGEERRMQELEAESPQRHDPYGGGGWQKVERKPAQAPVNLGLPAPRVDRLAPVVQAEPDRRLEIKEKTVESLGLSSSSSYGTKPVINFRKRKNNAVRQREDDD